MTHLDAEPADTDRGVAGRAQVQRNRSPHVGNPRSSRTSASLSSITVSPRKAANIVARILRKYVSFNVDPSHGLSKSV